MSDLGSDSSDFPTLEDLDLDLPQAPEPQMPWSNWMEEQKEILNQHFKYHQDMVLYLNQLWANGPSRDSVPKKPASEITQLLETGVRQKKKKNVDSISEMTNEEFNCYLLEKCKQFENMNSSKTTCKLPTNLSEIPAYLNQALIELQPMEATAFRGHLELGKRLNFAKGKFDAEKRKKRQKITFGMWIQENTQIKEACARRHREIASLTEKYPKLEKLIISYTEFLKIKNKIKKVFTENIEIGHQWQ
jgi:hypothetical protein